MPVVDVGIRRQAGASLLARASALRSVIVGPEITKRFSLAEIRQGAANAGVATWLTAQTWPYLRSQPTLYVITASDEVTAAALAAAFPAARNFAGPKVNEGAERSQTLYVGSSENIKKRLREHLWQVHAKTYAMHLNRWCPEGDGSISVTVQAILDNQSRQLRQDLEDAVWQRLRPVFGKQGGR